MTIVGSVASKLHQDFITRPTLKPMIFPLYSEEHVALALLNRGFYVSHFRSHSKRGLCLIAPTRAAHFENLCKCVFNKLPQFFFPVCLNKLLYPQETLLDKDKTFLKKPIPSNWKMH